MSDRWLTLGPGARWPQGHAGKVLRRKLHRVARRIRRELVITSGDRNAREAWEARMDYLNGGTLAAQCCDRTDRHSWAECGKTPWSKHADGRAADVELVRRNAKRVNIGESDRARAAMRLEGLCLPVGAGETWHVEVGTTWNS
jgi:hypothetical protein